MGQTHDDRDFSKQDGLFEELKRRAVEMTAKRLNTITAGEPGQSPIAEWDHGSMHVTRLPEDAQGVLRVSIGGNVGFGYCTFRGSREACRCLVEQALAALTADTPPARPASEGRGE